MIDPGMDPEEIFGDVKLPCELVRRMNNTINARELPDLPKEILKPKKVSAEVPKTLAQVEKSFKYVPTIEAPCNNLNFLVTV